MYPLLVLVREMGDNWKNEGISMLEIAMDYERENYKKDNESLDS